MEHLEGSVFEIQLLFTDVPSTKVSLNSRRFLSCSYPPDYSNNVFIINSDQRWASKRTIQSVIVLGTEHVEDLKPPTGAVNNRAAGHTHTHTHVLLVLKGQENVEPPHRHGRRLWLSRELIRFCWWSSVFTGLGSVCMPEGFSFWRWCCSLCLQSWWTWTRRARTS